MDFAFRSVTKTSGVTFVGSPAQNNVISELSLTFTIAEPIPISGAFVIGLPI